MPEKKITTRKPRKKAEAKPVVLEEEEIKPIKLTKYIEAVGRRKTSIARVRIITQGEKAMSVNGKPLEKYFQSPGIRGIITSPLNKMKVDELFNISVKVSGGGVHSQAEAIRHGIARALVEYNQEFRKRLRKSGYLTRDPRMKERKKFGLKRARRAPQWSKR